MSIKEEVRDFSPTPNVTPHSKLLPESRLHPFVKYKSNNNVTAGMDFRSPEMRREVMLK